MSLLVYLFSIHFPRIGLCCWTVKFQNMLSENYWLKMLKLFFINDNKKKVVPMTLI